MVALPYVGPAPAQPRDLTTTAYVNSRSSSNITQSQVNSLITTGLSPYVTKTYVDTQDALNATQAYVDGTGGANPNGGDAVLLKRAQIGAVNGPAGLDSGGRVDKSNIGISSGQRYPRPFYTPSSYNNADVPLSYANLSQGTLVYQLTVTDPGIALGLPPGAFSYKLMTFGTVDTTVAPMVLVTRGSTSGPVVASGHGWTSNRFVGGQLFKFTTVGGPSPWTPPDWATTLDVVCIGGGGGGGQGSQFGTVANGSGGGAGNWGAGQFVKGQASWPNTTSIFNITVGGGGGQNGGWGNPSQFAGTGITSVVGSGGAGADRGYNNPQGGLPGNYQFDELVYFGASGQTGGLGAWGVQPGSGGNGGEYNFWGGQWGGGGGHGQVWVFASPTPNKYPRGPVSLVPTPFNVQSALTGDTTLYVQMFGSAPALSGIGATTTLPSLWVCPVPA